MRWQSGRRSSNVEDRRSSRIPRGVKGGGIGILLLALVGMYFGIDPSMIMNVGNAVQKNLPANKSSEPFQATPEEQEQAEFISVVLADTEDVWSQVFRENGKTYQVPNLVLFSGAVQSACGFAQAAMGPFYCPGDRKVYIDLSFYKELQNSLHSRVISPVPMWLPMRSATMSRNCWVSAIRLTEPVSNFPKKSLTRFLCGWNCRPIVSPVSGPTVQTGCVVSLSPATLKRP